MNFLLDTNAVSEWVKPRPNPGLIRWMEEADEDRVFLSVISLAELHYGIERMAGERGATGLRVGFDMNYQCVSKAEFFRSTTQSRRMGANRFAQRGCGAAHGRDGCVPISHSRNPSPDVGDPQCF